MKEPTKTPHRFYATDRSMDIAKTLSNRLGWSFDPIKVRQDASQVLTLYYQDVVSALSPEFDHIPLKEFTLRKINAYAKANYPQTTDDQAFTHIDQQFDIWVSGLVHLWCIRAFHNLGDANRLAINQLFLRNLDMRDEPMVHEELREDMLPAFLQYTEELKVSHDVSLWAMVFVICHELAHHRLDHAGHERSHALEHAADLEGYKLMRRVVSFAGEFKTMRKQPYAMVGAYVVLSLFDLSERRQAQRAGRTMRTASLSHPFSSARLSRLKPLLDGEPNQYVGKFLEGFGAALNDIKSDLRLDAIR